MDIDKLATMMFEAAEATANELGRAVVEGPRDVEETKAMLQEDPEVLVFFTKFAALCKAAE
jgi:hypothetical protein